MSPLSRALAAACCAALLSGCARERDPELPAACATGPEPVERALAAAPEPVRLPGGVRLSECFVPASDSGAAQIVAGAYLPVATSLARRAETDERAALRLGYLVGAARRGIERAQGSYPELVRRLEQEAGSLPERSAAFRRGEAAGRRSG